MINCTTPLGLHNPAGKIPLSFATTRIACCHRHYAIKVVVAKAPFFNLLVSVLLASGKGLIPSGMVIKKNWQITVYYFPIFYQRRCCLSLPRHRKVKMQWCLATGSNNQTVFVTGICWFIGQTLSSLGYLLIYRPQIATVMKPVSFSSKYRSVSHTKSLGESREWNMFFFRAIYDTVWKLFKKWMNFLIFGHTRSILLFVVNKSI